MSIALPALPSLWPRNARAAARPPVFVAMYAPCGAYMPDWTPTGTGASWSLSRSLQPLEAYKDRTTVVSGMTATATVSELEGFHRRATASWLTCTPISATYDLEALSNGWSIDQLIADRDHAAMPLPSLQLGQPPVAVPEDPLKPHAGIYMAAVSWRGNVPLVGLSTPGALWQRLTGTYGAPTSQTEAVLRAARGRSVLDQVRDDLTRMRQRLGTTDDQRLDAYLTGLRELERELAASLSPPTCSALTLETAGVDPAQHYDTDPELLIRLVGHAIACDLTRVATIMISSATPSRVYDSLGHDLDHHTITHHLGDPVRIAQTQQVDTLQASFLARFVDQLATTTDAEGASLLDNAVVLYGSGMGDGSLHSPDNVPMLYVGDAGGTLVTGQHLQATDRPLADLHLTLLQALGHEREAFADSTGPMGSLLTG